MNRYYYLINIISLIAKRKTIFLLLLTCNLWAYASSVDKMRLLSLLKQTDFYITSENYEKAAELRDQALVLFKGLGAENDSSTISELHKISHAYSEKKMFSEAVKTESVLVDIFPLAIPDKKLDYALYLNDLSLYLLDDNNIVLAEKNIKKALSLIKNKNDVNVATIFFRAAEIYSETTPQRIELSIKYQKKAVDIYANKYGKSSAKYLDELWYLANYYEKAEDYNNACNAYLDIMHTRADDNNEKDLNSFIPILDRIIYCSRKKNDTIQEKRYKEIAYGIKIQEQEYHEAKYPFVNFPSEKDSLDYLIISQKIDSYKVQHGYSENDDNETDFMQIYDYYATLPDSYGKAYSMSAETIRNSLMLNWKGTIDFGTETLRIFDNLGIITDKYVIVLCCIATAYYELDNPAKAYDYILRAYELRDDYLSSDNRYYDGIPGDLAVYCSALGNYRDAVKYGLLEVKSKEPIIYSEHPFGYYRSLANLASYYGKFDKGVELKILQQLINRAETITPSVLEDPESSLLYNLASCYLFNGDYSHAIETGLKVKDIREKWGEKSFLSNIYSLLAKAYRFKGQTKEALRYAIQFNSIQKEIGGDDNLSLSDSYNLLAKISMDMGNYKEAERFEKNSINLVYNNIINNFVDLSSDDRTSYWFKYSRNFNIWYPNHFYQAKVDDATELYNKCALFSKGILLATETEMSKLITESGDEKALAKYQQILLGKSILSQKASGKQTKEIISTDSLRAEIDRLERELIKECKVYGDYTANLRITWKDVQATLKPNDIAIEFISFPLMENDSVLNKTLYAALIIRKDDNKPHFVELFEEAELDRLGNNDVYSEDLYRLIWEPIDRLLSGINNIYFSPAGKLYNLNIEILPELFGNNDGRNYYRVSSTRLLAQSDNNSQTTKEKAIIYGGLNYDATISELIADSKLHTRKESSYRGNVDNLDLRYGWDYLPETLVEVNAIESTMNKNEIHTQVYTDTLGTEASFKSLDGQSCKIIHIATHGFYYSKDDSVKMKSAKLDYLANQMDSYSRSYEEDLSLTRSGLLMAGCNNILRGYKLPNDIDDGILFSKEIAGMNLKNVELTVLSSCDSGLGDVTGEGVFGLQRAFKKAGAQSILMSLHKVDDEATRILMVEFYKNLMAGKSKHQSLKDAQHHLRQVENGKYDNPKYWASFIMLDG